jgi:biopolymer transport protein TolQ
MIASPVVLASLLGEVGALIARSGIFAKFIVLLLFTLSVISWAVMAERARMLAAARAGNRGFWRRFDRARGGEIGMGELVKWCEGQDRSPLAALFRWFGRDYWSRFKERQDRGMSADQELGMLARGVDRQTTARMQLMERGLGWLATLAAVAPFLGLLGTVWGIMNSFLQLGRQGSATLDVVGPGIAEALITTVCGLGVAIPAVVGYNWFSRRLQDHETEMRRLGSLLADLVSEEETAVSEEEPAARPARLTV